ncbi:uncharacterized protein LOC113325206 [Papaver somniferum]|uniref:uncharacterized protein LOC113325206 n=1 Tax=Papaver somniferum TaxID=3469 RepID=UPI000E704B02|nr:uncharacterized protein LOC113325206 [Papaver somniferum]
MFHAAPKTSNVKGHLFLKAYNGEHKCCAGYSDGTKDDLVTRKLIKSLIFEKIEQNPDKKARDIVRELKSDYGLEKHDPGSRADLVVEGGEFKRIFPLAYGIVSAETVENWHWFLKKLESILGPRHLKNNVRSKTNKKKGEHCAAMGLFKECFYSSTHEGFDQGMQKLKDMRCDGLHNFLSEIQWNVGPMHIVWAVVTATCVQTLQSPLTLGSRKQKMSTRKRKGATYKGFICPRLEKKVLASIRAGVQWRITKSGDMEWEVFDGKHTHAVNIAKFQCNCRVWFTEQFPCDHAIACMHSNNINVYEYINPYFSIASFRASYDRPIKPIPDYDKPIDVATGDLVNPPTVVGKKHGSPKKKRIPNTSSASFKRPITCGNCHTHAHHNKTTCPHPPAKKQR